MLNRQRNERILLEGAKKIVERFGRQNYKLGSPKILRTVFRPTKDPHTSISANAAMDEDTEVIDEKRNAEEDDDVDANNTTGGNPTNLTVDSSLLDSSLSEPRRIKKLDPTVVNRIAAGTQQT